MAQVLVRNLDDDVVAKLKARAKREGRSLQSEVKLILVRAVEHEKWDPETAYRKIREFQRGMKPSKTEDAVAMIREDRDR
jgi:antitoxin FitA